MPPSKSVTYRASILDALHTAPGPLNAAAIWREISGGNGMSLETVARHLRDLMGDGVIVSSVGPCMWGATPLVCYTPTIKRTDKPAPPDRPTANRDDDGIDRLRRAAAELKRCRA